MNTTTTAAAATTKKFVPMIEHDGKMIYATKTGVSLTTKGKVVGPKTLASDLQLGKGTMRKLRKAFREQSRFDLIEASLGR